MIVSPGSLLPGKGLSKPKDLPGVDLGSSLRWNDTVCLYFDRYRIKYFWNLRFSLFFLEGSFLEVGSIYRSLSAFASVYPFFGLRMLALNLTTFTFAGLN